ncbi:hypothetical protein PENSUB_13698 [Penicillium subrubescens]|uniref:Uncharacterized protein n=1 Tax=Penicillium subrubescens TaxID=1316194 RepID=A0A1Q5SNT0_9EURO|nr:hypothetical protein PENSUB_13698 [Penicillium subrubescens]
MLAIYYGDAWGAKSQPFMSTVFHTADGKRYPSSQVFPGDVLSESALAKYGITRITGTFAYAMFMANAASTILYGRYGNGIAINNLSKMIAGLTLPGRLIGNM